MRPVLITGPTASGKSALALAIAERDGGCVINADALQVYSCWRVLTARPVDADHDRAPHMLYGHVACDAGYSVGAWLREIAPVIAEVQARGQRPVIVGGTGLYLSALTTGLADVPEIPPEVRMRSDAQLRLGGVDALIADLVQGDPATLARIDPNNPRRVQRAWDVLMATGRGLHEWRRGATAPILAPDGCVRICLQPDAVLLDSRIRVRLERMMELGALEECLRFRAAGHDPGAPSGRALGAAELIAHLEGRLTLDAALAAAATATRRYAKRQRTWFRSRMSDWTPIDPAEPGALKAVSVR